MANMNALALKVKTMHRCHCLYKCLHYRF